LGEDFTQAAEAAGVEIRLGQEAVEVVIAEARAAGVALADGGRVMAGAVISTLDLKQSMLSLFAWSALPAHMLEQARNWRMAGASARLLLALKRPLRRDRPLFLAGDDEARAAFRHGVVPKTPPLLLDMVSRRDASLAPPGAATATVTLSAIPHRLFDGGWTGEKRAALAARTLLRIEKLLPGTLATIQGVRILTPLDMEMLLGITGGDLDGGALAPDQMLSLRPGPRTAVPGFYLGGRSTQAGALGTGAAGFAAAAALMADGAR
jgi:phytoene dehydrogenase-like protein